MKTIYIDVRLCRRCHGVSCLFSHDVMRHCLQNVSARTQVMPQEVGNLSSSSDTRSMSAVLSCEHQTLPADNANTGFGSVQLHNTHIQATRRSHPIPYWLPCIHGFQVCPSGEMSTAHSSGTESSSQTSLSRLSVNSRPRSKTISSLSPAGTSFEE